jgi:hypothetical protein
VKTRILLRGVGVAGADVPTLGRFRPQVGAFERIVANISGPDEAIRLASSGLPPGAAHAEAVAIRLRRGGAELVWEEPRALVGATALVALCERRGRSSVEIVRTDPSLLTELQLGSWFDADWRVRLLRRVSALIPRAMLCALGAQVGVGVIADLAFWQGVRAAATATEWTRWTRSSYVALVYHRIAGERKPGQERFDVAPVRFKRHVSTLRRLGFHHLKVEEMLALHGWLAPAPFPHRAFVITVDDAFGDCFEPLREHASLRPQLFVPTQELGGTAYWAGREPLMGWDEVLALAAAGVQIGSHARRHRRLRGLDATSLIDELVGSRADLRIRLAAPLDVVAYPYGAHDERVSSAAAEAGFEAAFATDKGRNGAGTNRHSLRRVSVHEADGSAAVLWKVVTGEALPHAWLKIRDVRACLGAVKRATQARARLTKRRRLDQSPPK